MTETVLKNDAPARLPTVDSSRCDGCNQCIKACPRAAIYKPGEVTCSKCIKYCLSMEVPCSHARIAFSYEACDACGRCLSACVPRALSWASREWLFPRS